MFTSTQLSLEGGPWSKRILRVACVLLILRGFCPPGFAADLLEQQVKAAMLYNFVHFVEWPTSKSQATSSPMVFGVAGPETFARALQAAVEGKSRAGRRLEVRRLKSPAEVEGCDVVFVSASEKKQFEGYLRAARASSVLTVSDISGFVQAGGIIGFVMAGGRIRFAINQPAATKAGLSLSSQLRELAVSDGAQDRN